MSDKEILQVDFYDLCGIDSIGMNDQEKISYWREIIENLKPKIDENKN